MFFFINQILSFTIGHKISTDVTPLLLYVIKESVILLKCLRNVLTYICLQKFSNKKSALNLYMRMEYIYFWWHMELRKFTDTENSNSHWYLNFAKLTRFNRAVKLSNLPPMTAAAQECLYHVYYQVHTWLGKDIHSQQWILNNHFLEPVMIMLPPALDNILEAMFFNYAKDCGINCGYRKIMS